MPVVHLMAYNATLPISRLLIPELFSEILHHALDQEPPRPLHADHCYTLGAIMRQTRTGQKLRLGAAVTASHVCYAWRASCVSTPTLWSRQIGRIPKATSTFLDRSGHALLDIAYSREHADCWQSCPAIDPSLVRTLVWDASNEPENVARMFRELVANDLLNLESLDVYLRIVPNLHDTLIYPELFGSTPRLRILDMTDIFLPIHAPRLTNLNLHSVTVPLSQLARVLRAAPLLERFEFVESLISMPSESGSEATWPNVSHRDLIKLDRLHDIHLENSGHVNEAYRHLLSSLSIAPTSFSAILYNGLSVSLLVHCICTIFRNKPLSFLSLELLWAMWFEPPPRATYLPPECSTLADVEIGYLEWWFESDSYGPTLRALHLQELCYVTELQLSVYVAEYAYTKSLRALLCALPGVATLWIVRGTPELTEDPGIRCFEILHALTSVWDEPGSTGDKRLELPLPLLKTLGIDIAELDPMAALEQISQTIAHRDGDGAPKLHTLSLPYIPRPSDHDGSTANVGVMLERQTERVYWMGNFDDSSDSE